MEDLERLLETLSLYLQFLVAGITMGTIYAMVGVGFSFIYRVTKVLNFAQGEFLMLGGMVAISMGSFGGAPPFVAFIVSFLVVTILGIFFYQGPVKALSKAEPVRIILLTIAGSMFLQGAAFMIWKTDDYSMAPFIKTDTIQYFGASINPQIFPILIAAALITVVLKIFFDKTIWGKATTACAESREASMLLGIHVERMGMLSFAMSTGIGAIGGFLIAPITLMQYQKGVPLAIKGITGAVIGGLGSIWGSMLGGFFIGLVEALSSGFIASYLTDVIVFLILILVLFVKPEGLLSKKE